ncbi:MAG TPA: hypothetical protein VLK23_19260, partial [Thermodesulfobacteriota bacterium]|nr:hypothetical protein [Thermodesulfobacteriota bacterium]
SISQSQQNFITYLLEKLNWEEQHYHAFSQRIIKRPAPLTKRDGQKIIIGLMAILRKRGLQRRAAQQEHEEHP